MRSRKFLSLLLTTVVLVAIAATAQSTTTNSNSTSADVPLLVKFGGHLDNVNVNVNGTVGVTFALYTQQTGGAPLWLETQNVTVNANGYYSVYLGAASTNGLPLDVFSSAEAQWLGVQPAGQAEQPRVLLVSVPYALKAADADTLGGQPLSAFVLSSGSTSSSGTSSTSSTAATSVAVPAVRADATAQAQDVTGSGTPNMFAKWDSSGANLVTSLLFDNGSAVGLGTTSPVAAFDLLNTTAPASGVSPLGFRAQNIVTQGQTNNYPQNNFTSIYSGTGTQGSIYGQVNQVLKTGTGPITTAYGMVSDVENQNATGTITNAYGFYAMTPNRTGAITNSYAFYQDDPASMNYFGGTVGIGTLLPGAALDIVNTTAPASGVSPLGFRAQNIVTQGQTNNFPQNNFSSIYSGTGTQGSIYGQVNQILNTNTGSITNAYGLVSDVQNQNAGGAITNAYAFYAETPVRTGTITNSYAFYQDDPASINYFGGSLGIGTLTPDSPLTVAGVIESTSGGFKFPNGSVQISAASSGVQSVSAADSTITVGGPATSPTLAVNTTMLSGLFAPASGSPDYAPVSGSTNYAPASGSPNYAPASGSANYVAKAGDTMTGALTLPAVTGSATQALNLTSGTGQAVNLTAATGSGSGGTVTIDAGKAGTTSGGTGGSLNLNAGGAMPQGGAGYTNAGPGGSVNLAAGSGYNTVGGNVVLTSGLTSPWALALNSFSEVSLQGGIVNAGDAASLNVEGGHTVVTGGPAPSAGGNVIVKGGTADGSYAGGNIVLQPGTGTPNGTVEVAGNVQITGLGNGLEFADGTTQTTAGGAGGGVTSVTAGNSTITIGGTATAPTVALNTATTDARYAPLTGSANYVAEAGGTMTGALTLPANGLQMAGNQIVTTGGQLGYGATPPVDTLFDIGGTMTEPAPSSYGAYLLQLNGTVKSNASGQAYLKGLVVVPTFNVTSGYANYLMGIDTYMSTPVGSNVAYSVVGYNLETQPTSGVECNVGFGIGVPNQNTSLCNGKYGFYQGDTNAQYNYFASNVGIGTPFPGAMLEVNGAAKFDGLVTFASGQTFPGASVSISSPDSSITVGGTASAPTLALNTSLTNALYAPVSGSTNYAPASGSANYVAKAGDTMTGALTLPAVTGSTTQALNLTSGTGQAVNLTAATGSGSGGTVTIDAGKAGTTSGGTGGSLNLNAGGAMPQGGAGYTNVGPGGSVNLAAGSGYNTVGGNVVLTSGLTSPWALALNSFSEVSLQGGIVNAGDAASLNVEGGHTVVTGGPAPSAGGNVIVKGGTADGSYAGGNIVLQPGTGTPNGTVEVAGNVQIVGLGNGLEFADGTTQTTAGGAGGGVTSVTAGNSTITIGGTATAPTVALNTATTDARYAPLTGSANYVAEAGGTMTGALTLPANGLQMAGNQIVTTGGQLGYGATPPVDTLFDIGGTMTEPAPSSYGAYLLQLNGTVKSNASGQAYLKGLVVVPTFNVTSGYANYLMGIDTYMSTPVGSNVAYSVVGYNLETQPTSGVECNVGFGIGVPNQNTSLCNGKYGFYQGDTNAQYNYFASNVGIGTPFPSQALTVQGNVLVNGDLTVTGSTVTGSTTQALNLTSGTGQAVNLTAATGSASGATVTIDAGNAGTSSGGTGGSLNLNAGGAMPQGGSGYTNAGPGGSVNLAAGSGYNTVGGNVVLTSGLTSPWALAVNSFSEVSLQGGIVNSGDAASLNVEGGHTVVTGGPAPSAGGNVIVKGGTADGSYAGGNIVLQPGTGTPNGTVQVTGNLTTTGTGALPVYNSSGAAQTAAHMVTGTVSVNSSGSVTLTGTAVFSSASSYVCTATAISSSAPTNPAGVTNNSGSSFTVYGNFDASVNYICVGD